MEAKVNYERQAIKELKRVADIFSGKMTIRQYNSLASQPYKFEAMRDRLKMKFNELKALAGLPVNKNKSIGNRKRNKKQINTTKRYCNMSHCGKLFEAVDHMRSCPTCTDLKNNSAYY
jgi:hypothetical protein